MIGWKSSVAQMQITRISIKNLFRYVLKKVYKTILILEYNLTSPLKNPNKKNPQSSQIEGNSSYIQKYKLTYS